MVVLVLFSNCSHVYVNEKNVPKIEYEIIKKDWFVFKDYKTDTVYQGYILLRLPDTIVTYYQIANNAMAICVNEDMPYAKFYLTKDCLITKNHIDKSREYENLDCYIGLLDVRSKGLKWKYLLTVEDFNFQKQPAGILYENLIFDNK